ncbi:LacI family DNA-binding transcriptional regulator [Bifidobacterium felsineum]|uniref:LacI family transcriptional regulator n=1 Tax=Bifidobacterium felsineum TaxID=2045440 RepID=A0A2M9HIJ8_9BIFI|nr:LacI family DNA-binding transcriptional regulator [Bifidobacterium felsineum]MBT1164912.1 LacI family DNA-binding transcriptional regulator [Bifidobacterium felsineum]PJM76648.1 LacI family transcriptional regulator [Bifidobacterium felsineum]
MVAGSRKATLHDVAKCAHVSVASVSNYLNDYPYMRPSTRERIQKAIDELGYVTNQQARNLRSGRTGLISLSLPDLNQIYFAELAEETIKQAREYGYRVIIESTGNDRQREIESARAMASNMTDGLILSPTQLRTEDIPELEGDYPLVVLGERLFGAPAPHVVMANETAARAATEHLLKAGCRTIAVVGGTLDDSVPSSRSMRTKGYVNALADHGQSVRGELVREIGEWTSAEGAKAVRDMYAQGIRPDGIFALNDLLAMGVISQLREMRVRVPESVRVVGFDDIDEAKYTIPSLTTVDPGRAKIAKLAIESILDQLNNRARAPRSRIDVGFQLKYRASSPQV